eukprot:TRINITY_DN5313_c0_g1_i4.p7 TRINITY_DN5313_c0_g1~~TRINITY_DN5313_c0_g1_i4.p7  ORF type:complete len:101 (-),score=0.12 TRINITY_DN5313_c0_g1_i4:1092-1394(-)
MLYYICNQKLVQLQQILFFCCMVVKSESRLYRIAVIIKIVTRNKPYQKKIFQAHLFKILAVAFATTNSQSYYDFSIVIRRKNNKKNILFCLEDIHVIDIT